jgi:hypothetical protein
MGDALPPSLDALADAAATALRGYTCQALATLTDYGYPAS